MKHNVSDIKSFEITRGFSARMIHADSMTIAFVEVEEGAELPVHAHPHEQVTNVLEGVFEIVVGSQPVLLKAGESVVIPSNVPHSGKAHTHCRILDVFSPVREDFRKGEVSYAVR
jgi:quercetin dioxygenase-like cupin family protein